MMRSPIAVAAVHLRFYEVPTVSFGEQIAESDGTAEWDSSGVLLVELTAGDTTGVGFAYTTSAALVVARDVLVPRVLDSDPFDTARSFWAMADSVRNQGWPGIAASAISAIDLALHDLKARLLDVSLTQLLGGARRSVQAYGSGGFTSYDTNQLQRQLGDWAASGMRAVKMKVGRTPEEDISRVRAARSAIGTNVELFVDANGAYDRKQALVLAGRFAELGVSWFEEPVSSDDLEGMRLIRDRAPDGMRIAAGEYGYTPSYFAAMLRSGAVDVQQADSTRCGGATGFVLAASEALGAHIPISAHTAPALHASLGAALPNVLNVEYFHDHVQIESLFFDGLPAVQNGELVPNRTAPGNGLTFKESNALQYLKVEAHCTN